MNSSSFVFEFYSKLQSNHAEKNMFIITNHSLDDAKFTELSRFAAHYLFLIRNLPLNYSIVPILKIIREKDVFVISVCGA